jgi:hypothetical protein
MQSSNPEPVIISHGAINTWQYNILREATGEKSLKRILEIWTF